MEQLNIDEISESMNNFIHDTQDWDEDTSVKLRLLVLRERQDAAKIMQEHLISALRIAEMHRLFLCLNDNDQKDNTRTATQSHTSVNRLRPITANTRILTQKLENLTSDFTQDDQSNTTLNLQSNNENMSIANLNQFENEEQEDNNMTPQINSTQASRRLPNLKIPRFDLADPIQSIRSFAILSSNMGSVNPTDLILHFLNGRLELLSSATTEDKSSVPKFVKFLSDKLGLSNPRILSQYLRDSRQQSGESFLAFMSRVETIYRTLNQIEETALLSETDKPQIITYFIGGLLDPEIRRQLLLEDVSYADVLKRANTVKLALARNSETGIINSVQETTVQCDHCGLHHATDNCLASAKIKAKFRVKTGTAQDQGYNNFRKEYRTITNNNNSNGHNNNYNNRSVTFNERSNNYRQSTQFSKDGHQNSPQQNQPHQHGQRNYNNYYNHNRERANTQLANTNNTNQRNWSQSNTTNQSQQRQPQMRNARYPNKPNNTINTLESLSEDDEDEDITFFQSALN